MKKTTICGKLIMALMIMLLMSSCFLFKKIAQIGAPENNPSNPETSINLPEKKKEKQKKKEPKEKKAEVEKNKPAPFNVPEFKKTVKKQVYKVVLFAPLYLDNLFDSTNNIPGRYLPQNVESGLDFYEGAKLALDSLDHQGYHLNVYVFDTKSSQNTLTNIIRSNQLANTDLIIGAVGNTELQIISNYARQHKVNFISATYPNNGGIKDNPYFIIVNSTLESHCKAIVDFAEHHFGSSNKNIVLLKRDISQGDMITKMVMNAYNKESAADKSPINQLIWSDNTTTDDLAKAMIPGKFNICIVTALDEDGARSIVQKLAPLAASYNLQIIGMPTWDGLANEFRYRSIYHPLNIYFTTPFYMNKSNRSAGYLDNNFMALYKTWPSDMAYKGFDITYYFTSQLKDHGIYFNGYLNDDQAQVINNYNFEPVYLSKNENQPDYFENQHLYFIQIADSTINRVK